MSAMKLYCIQVGAFRLPRGFVAARCRDANVPTVMPIYVYLIEHPKGLVLVDTGQSYQISDENTLMEEKDTLHKNQAARGYKPDDNEYLVISHMHPTTGLYERLPEFHLVVRKEELKAAWWPRLVRRLCFPNI